jgi:carboxylesterase type B
MPCSSRGSIKGHSVEEYRATLVFSGENPERELTSRSHSLGLSGGGTIESFKGIPFAQPPVGALRLKPPVPITTAMGQVDATTSSPASCPQFLLGNNIEIGNVPSAVTGLLTDIANSPLFMQLAGGQEDCLTLNVQRPAGTKAGDKLPVLVWIFGGGFELGGTATYDATNVLSTAMSLGKPVVFVAVQYRVGGFGFLAGKEVLADGSANLGLLDQRLGLQWVADNIASFGTWAFSSLLPLASFFFF